MRQNEQGIYRDRKRVELSDYCVTVILNAANMAKCVVFGVPLECSLLREALYLDGGQGKSTQQSAVPDCINSQNFKMCLQFFNQVSRKIARKMFLGGLGMGLGFGLFALFVSFSLIDNVYL